VPADKNNGVALPELKDPHVAANLIKIWLRSLPEPIVPFNLYQEALDVRHNHMYLKRKDLFFYKLTSFLLFFS
jgi:hypothetical protein